MTTLAIECYYARVDLRGRAVFIVRDHADAAKLARYDIPRTFRCRAQHTHMCGSDVVMRARVQWYDFVLADGTRKQGNRVVIQDLKMKNQAL